MLRFVKLLISLGFYGLDSARALYFRIVGAPVAEKFVVLMYHSVEKHESRRFERQMAGLLRVGQAVRADNPPGQGDAAGGKRLFVAVTFDDGYRSILENAVPILENKGIPAAIFVPSAFIGRRPSWLKETDHPDASERLMDAAELLDLQRRGALIGSHSVSHRALAELDQEEALAEMVESKEELERLLGGPVSTLALPYGSSSPEVLRLSKLAGYERVFLSVPLRLAGNVAEHVAGRIDVSPRDWSLEYRLKILGAYRWLPLAIAAKARTRAFLAGFVGRHSPLERSGQ